MREYRELIKDKLERLALSDDPQLILASQGTRYFVVHPTAHWYTLHKLEDRDQKEPTDETTMIACGALSTVVAALPINSKSTDSYTSIQLAQLWVKLNEVRLTINGVILPLAAHLDIDDPMLVNALENVIEKIDQHFERHRLEAMRVRPGATRIKPGLAEK